MQLIQYQILDVLGSFYYIAVLQPSQDQFHHHVVRKQYIGWVCDYLFFLFIAFLASIFIKGYWALTFRIALAEEFLQFKTLAVSEGVHRVDYDCLDPSATTMPQYIIYNGNYVGQALARPSACGKHIIIPGLCGFNCVYLVTVES